MTKEFRSLGQKSAILFIIVTVINMGYFVTGGVGDPGGREMREGAGKMNRANSRDDFIFLRRLVSAAELARTKHQGTVPKEHYTKNRQWYDKPWRKNFEHKINEHRDRIIASNNEQNRGLVTKSSSSTNSPKTDVKISKHVHETIFRHRRQIRSFPSSPFSRFAPGGERGPHLPLDGFPSNSQSMDHIWSTRTRALSLLNHKLTGQHLQILEDGTVTLSRENIYCILRFKPIAYENNKVVLKIFAEVSKMYLALGGNGNLYATKDGNNPDTDFIHGFHVNYDAYLSREHRRYIALSSKGKPVRKSRKSLGSDQVAPRRTSHFLVLNVSTELKNELHEYGKTTATALSTTTPVLPEGSSTQRDGDKNQQSPEQNRRQDVAASETSSESSSQLTLAKAQATTTLPILQDTTSSQMTQKKRNRKKCRRKSQAKCKKNRRNRKRNGKKNCKQKNSKGRKNKKERNKNCKKKGGSKKRKRTRRSSSEILEDDQDTDISGRFLKLYQYLRRERNTLDDASALNLHDIT